MLDHEVPLDHPVTKSFGGQAWLLCAEVTKPRNTQPSNSITASQTAKTVSHIACLLQTTIRLRIRRMVFWNQHSFPRIRPNSFSKRQLSVAASDPYLGLAIVLRDV